MTPRATSGDDGPPSPAADSLLARAHELELPVLLDLVRECFPGRRVRFASDRSGRAKRNPVERVRVDGDTVTVALNLGFFSATSPLPGYFQGLLDDPFITPALQALLAAVDDALLRAEVHSFYPEGAWRDAAQLVRMRRNLLCSAQLASPATVAWVLESAFPELTVDVRRAQLPGEVATEPARVGHAVLGESTLGEQGFATVPGLRAELLGVAECWVEHDWLVEAPRRVREIVLPTLEGRRVRLTLAMDMRGVQPALTLGGSPVLGMGVLERADDEPLILYDGVIE